MNGVQERIMTIPYGHEKEVFSSSLFVVLCNRLCSCMLAAVILMVFPAPAAATL